MTRLYELNCGQYVLTDDGKPVGRLLDEVALVFDSTDGVLYRHGDPKPVKDWYEKTSSRMSAAGMAEWAGHLVCVSGRFPLKELNRCLTTAGYACQLYERVKNESLAPQPLIDDQPAVLKAARSRRP